MPYWIISSSEWSALDNRKKRLTEAEDEELGELTTLDWHDQAAKTAQLVRIIDRRSSHWTS
jgi:hypothetical protein